MRLGQLARKLELRPAEIIEFLATKNIEVEDDANAKVDENYVAMVFQRFAPGKEVENFPDANILPVVPNVAGAERLSGESAIPDTMPVNETGPERTELIKAPKVELSGLKVLGKIDLPETKKKEPEGASENSAPEQPKEFSKERRNQNFKRGHRPAKNPIALQREREALDAQKKREEELQQKKEARTQNYLKKVKAHQPTKAARLIKEEAEEISFLDLQEPPKTWWGKFIKWLTN